MQKEAVCLKRILAALLAAFLLAACMEGETEVMREATIDIVTGVPYAAIPQQVVFAVKEDADGILFEAAQAFCRRVAALSSGNVVIVTKKSPNPVLELRVGGAELILLDAADAGELHPFFGVMDEDFRYKSYEHFSMATNSAQVLQKLSNACGIRVYSAFYTGSDFMAGLLPLDETFALDRDGQGEGVPVTVTAYTFPDTGTDISLSTAADLVVKAESFAERFAIPLEEGMIVELKRQELLEAAHLEEGLVVTRTFHSVKPAWFMLSNAYYDNLTHRDRMCIDEAAAYLNGGIDEKYLELEATVIAELETAGAVCSDAFTETRAKVLRERAGQRDAGSADEASFREVADRIL